MKKYPKGTRPRPLPPTLPEACASLIDGLRDLKDRSGLTLAELADLTAISKSSWERYLNGKQFPPRHAVDALCLAVRSPDTDILERWVRAEAVWSGRDLDNTAPREILPAATGNASSRAALSGAGPVPGPAPRQTPGPVRALLLAASERITEHPAATVIGVLLASAMMIVPAALYHRSHNALPASQALPPICRLKSCAGRDPRTTACEDPRTLASYTATDGTRLELRLSPRCQAGWIRARPTHAGFRIEISSPGQRSFSNTATRRAPVEDLVTTPMIAAPQPSRLRACYYASADRPGRECFAP
ncbi:helix-turn-helix domain-containing protein [Streptomyces sp. NPDC004658]|uniref:helix-turn-helix domain-containing protein n=1 Tax=Streptomyces sp. NPDC004658 TaxID=3154672 RepID=UPI0033ABEB2F